MLTTQQDFLTKHGCNKPGCKHSKEILKLQPNCHPDNAVIALYDFRYNAVTVHCSVCSMAIIAVAVAPGKPSATKPIRPSKPIVRKRRK